LRAETLAARKGDDFERFATIQIIVLSRNNTDDNGSADIKRRSRRRAFSALFP
jgi:hypothetical protein